MNTDTKQQIETALRAFSGSDLRAASIGLLNSLGYQSEKTLDLDNTPDAFLAEFDKRDRKYRKGKALFERWKSVKFLFQITDDEVRNAGAQGTLFDSGYDHGNYQSYLFFAHDLKKNHYTRTQLADITREINLLFDMPAMHHALCRLPSAVCSSPLASSPAPCGTLLKRSAPFAFCAFALFPLTYQKLNSTFTHI